MQARENKFGVSVMKGESRIHLSREFTIYVISQQCLMAMSRPLTLYSDLTIDYEMIIVLVPHSDF